jgi:glycosyltransferase involved in cell wall biosynthesis
MTTTTKRSGLHFVLISAEYPPSIGGVSDYAANLAAALEKIGHRVSIITSETGVSEGLSMESTAEVVGLAALGLGWRWRDASAVARLVSSMRPDVVNVQYVPQMYGRAGISPGVALLVWLLGTSRRHVLILTCHEVASPLTIHPRRLIAALSHRLQLVVALAARPTVVVTNTLDARRLQRWLPAACPVVIPVGPTVPHRTQMRSQVDRVRESLGVGAKFLIGDFSPYNVNKNPSDLLSVLEAVGVDGRLLLIGGAHASEAKRTGLLAAAGRLDLTERIIEIPYLSREKLSDHLAALDVYVDTSMRGASTRSTTLVTALAHGLPVVAYQGPETPDYFKSEEQLLLVRPGDPRRLADAVLRVRDSPTLSARLAIGAHNVYEKHLTWELIAGAIVAST